jgi:hypothetical protein
MKSKKFLLVILEIILIVGYFYFVLPPINIQSGQFWLFIWFILGTSGVLFFLAAAKDEVVKIISRGNTIDVKGKSKAALVCFGGIAVTFAIYVIVNVISGPIFNAKAYSQRITIDDTKTFADDIELVDFTKLPLLDKTSSQKLGDRIMGQMNDLVSQFNVSDDYTQINYNENIVRVTPLQYADLIKWFTNRDQGVPAYITVNSVDGKAELTKLDKGMKYVPSAHFNEKLIRKLRFNHLFDLLGDPRFEIDNDGNPYYIVPVYKVKGIGRMAKVSHVIIFNPIDGTSKKYKVKDVPSWVDNAHEASLIIDQVNDWGQYKKGFWNTKFGQKGVVATTEGYNYLAMNDDIYLYTGITSVLADESNLGFILSNMRTGETTYYEVAGAEEYSAMDSAEGQVQQMKYKSTFPLLINLNNKPTYLVSLKDNAGLVKMYGFVDVQDYQKVVVTDSSEGIDVAAQNYLNKYSSGTVEDSLTKEKIIVDKISTVVKDGNTYYYISSKDGKKYVASIKTSEELPFVSSGDTIEVGFYETKKDIIEIKKIYKNA